MFSISPSMSSVSHSMSLDLSLNIPRSLPQCPSVSHSMSLGLSLNVPRSLTQCPRIPLNVLNSLLNVPDIPDIPLKLDSTISFLPSRLLAISSIASPPSSLRSGFLTSLSFLKLRLRFNVSTSSHSHDLNDTCDMEWHLTYSAQVLLTEPAVIAMLTALYGHYRTAPSAGLQPSSPPQPLPHAATQH
jgi:hypothetical protein